MQVLLIKDVDNLGYAGDVKKVANGFGRNYLIPQKMAILATPGALKQAETVREIGERRRAQEMEDAKAIANQIKDLVLVFERRSGEMGKLYGSVTPKDIAEKIKEDLGINLDKRKIALAEPIRQLGMHNVTIKVVIDLSVDIKVEVLTEGGIVERARQEAKAKAAAAKAQAEAEAAEAEAKTTAEAPTSKPAPASSDKAGEDDILVNAAADLLETA